MKRTLLSLFLISILSICYAQTPTYYVHNPANMGVNNSFMHNSVTKKFLFIYNKAELNAAGITGATSFNTIWFRMNNSGTVNLSNCIITIGHTTLTSTTPSATFSSNFNVGAPTTVLSINPLSYTFIAGAWNMPANNWSPITLSSAFTYNDINNLAVMIEFSAQSGTIPSLYASSTGTTQYTNTVGGSTATSTTSRPAFGISNTTPLFNTPILEYHIQGDKVILSSSSLNSSFTKQELAFSTNRGENWSNYTLSSIHENWFIDMPAQYTLYRMWFTDKDGYKYASNIIEIYPENYPKSLIVSPTIIHNGEFSITYPELNYGTLQITDFTGKIVHIIPDNTTTSTKVQLALPAGMYFLQDLRHGRVVKLIIQ